MKFKNSNQFNWIHEIYQFNSMFEGLNWIWSKMQFIPKMLNWIVNFQFIWIDILALCTKPLQRAFLVEFTDSILVALCWNYSTANAISPEPYDVCHITYACNHFFCFLEGQILGFQPLWTCFGKLSRKLVIGFSLEEAFIKGVVS